MRLWANGKVIVSAKDEKDRDDLITELGLEPYSPPMDKTLDEIVKILAKVYPNIMIGLMGSWHELWDGEVIKFDIGIMDTDVVKKNKRGLVAEYKDDVWIFKESWVSNGI